MWIFTVTLGSDPVFPCLNFAAHCKVLFAFRWGESRPINRQGWRPREGVAATSGIVLFPFLMLCTLMGRERWHSGQELCPSSFRDSLSLLLRHQTRCADTHMHAGITLIYKKQGNLNLKKYHPDPSNLIEKGVVVQATDPLCRSQGLEGPCHVVHSQEGD